MFGQFGIVLRFKAGVFGGQFVVLTDVLADAAHKLLSSGAGCMIWRHSCVRFPRGAMEVLA